MTTIPQELDKARRNLLDLTMRNRLLNYRPNRTKSIRVMDEDPAEIYDALVLREKKLDFRGTGAKKKDGVPNAEWGLRSSPWTRLTAATAGAHHSDRYLQTPHDDLSLATKLFNVFHEGESVVQEQGYTVVHLAIGFLEYYESSDAQIARRAPLLLIPAELERIAAGDFSRLSWTGEDVFMNISLAAKLVEQGVNLPSFEAPEEKDGIDAWLASVSETIAKRARWSVLSDIALDFFSFTKFVMFKDLDPASWPEEKQPENHPLLRSLFAPESEPKADDGFDEVTVDEKLSARDLHHVMDADPSQIAVIEDVKAMRNLVVEGPPGTGKSQTISNVIAETLAAGRTVLFVSEKMAALEVVKSRLDLSGLGPFCVELHSRKANKKAFLDELKRSLASIPPSAENERLFEEHEQLKRELNAYAEDLGRQIGISELNPWNLISMKERAGSALNRLTPNLQFPRFANIETCSAAVIHSVREKVHALALAFSTVAPLESHPWKASELTQMLPHEESELAELLDRVTAGVSKAKAAAERLAAVCGAERTETPASILRACAAAEVVTRASGATESSVLLSTSWNSPNTEADAVISRVADVQKQRQALNRKFKRDFMETPVREDLLEFEQLAARFFRIFSSEYRSLRKKIVAGYSSAAGSNAQVIADLKALLMYQEAREALTQDKSGVEFFGHRWRAETSDVRELREFAEWVVEFRRALISKVLTEKSVELMTRPLDRNAVSGAAHDARAAVKSIQEEHTALVDRAALVHEKWDANLSLDTTSEKVARWRHELPRLFQWSLYRRALGEVHATFAGTIEPSTSAPPSHAEALVPLFDGAVADALLRVPYSERPPLAQFVGSFHEQKIQKFREIDSNLIRVNRARLSRKLHEARPTIVGGVSRSSEAGILVGEFQRKRGHKPIRKLLASAGGIIQRIKPCFLMSPLSVAQFLDARKIRFDLIVFDEASQVRPEDALGALLRGNQLVVMGDAQQLPPTSFFDHLVDDETDELQDEATVGDVESILHQCARSYPTKTLNWHYRSRHESLIAISNFYFYHNSLRIYPSAIAESEDLGLHFRHLAGSVYDRGKSSTNRIEAQAVARAAMDHYRKWGHRKSLGVGTFNIRQQQAIQEEIEIQLKQYPELEPFFKAGKHEHFFVKNLETIQGDERDVILISIGYGNDAAGRLSLNFGPLNREGGQRRLNVLISRAREKCVVFSNFTAKDLSIESSSSVGLQALKSFLEFAQSRQMPVEMRPLEDTDSPFEDAVIAELESHGYEVRKQVGCAGFRVDIGVVDPDARGSYLLGIECDGAKYHSAPVARDRDRLRQQILEQLGWRIYRVWSTDWYRNRKETVQKLLLAVDSAKTSRNTFPTMGGNQSNEQSSNLLPFLGEAESNLNVLVTNVLAQSWVDSIPEYVTCASLRISIAGELHEHPASDLALAVEDVVAAEGPVHFDEVVRRIRILCGVGRAGNRIRAAIANGARIAQREGRVVVRGEFLWIPNQNISVRRRLVDPPPRIDLVCDEEIEAAVLHVLNVQHAMPESELVIQSSRALGMKATSGDAADRIARVTTKMLQSKNLARTGESVSLT